MSKVITFSRFFPAYHPKKGEPTYFVEKIFNGLVRLKLPIKSTGLDYDAELSNEEKYHTIRSGKRWNVGDKFSPRVWSGKPYCSPMLEIAPDIEVKKVWDIKITTQNDDGEHDWSFIEINDKSYTVYSDEYLSQVIKDVAKNDGLSTTDLFEWFRLERTKNQKLNDEDKVFDGQIICWNEQIVY